MFSSRNFDLSDFSYDTALENDIGYQLSLDQDDDFEYIAAFETN